MIGRLLRRADRTGEPTELSLREPPLTEPDVPPVEAGPVEAGPVEEEPELRARR